MFAPRSFFPLRLALIFAGLTAMSAAQAELGDVLHIITLRQGKHIRSGLG